MEDHLEMFEELDENFPSLENFEPIVEKKEEPELQDSLNDIVILQEKQLKQNADILKTIVAQLNSINNKPEQIQTEESNEQVQKTLNDIVLDNRNSNKQVIDAIKQPLDFNFENLNDTLIGLNNSLKDLNVINQSIINQNITNQTSNNEEAYDNRSALNNNTSNVLTQSDIDNISSSYETLNNVSSNQIENNEMLKSVINNQDLLTQNIDETQNQLKLVNNATSINERTLSSLEKFELTDNNVTNSTNRNESNVTNSTNRNNRNLVNSSNQNVNTTASNRSTNTVSPNYTTINSSSFQNLENMQTAPNLIQKFDMSLAPNVVRPIEQKITTENVSNAINGGLTTNNNNTSATSNNNNAASNDSTSIVSNQPSITTTSTIQNQESLSKEMLEMLRYSARLQAATVAALQQLIEVQSQRRFQGHPISN